MPTYEPLRKDLWDSNVPGVLRNYVKSLHSWKVYQPSGLLSSENILHQNPLFWVFILVTLPPIIYLVVESLSGNKATEDVAIAIVVGIMLPFALLLFGVNFVMYRLAKNNAKQLRPYLEEEDLAEEVNHLSSWFESVGLRFADSEKLEHVATLISYNKGPSSWLLPLETTKGLGINQWFIRRKDGSWYLETK